MPPKTDESPTGRFRVYPINRVIGILPTTTAANAAVADLVAAGIPASSIETASGQEGLREIDFTGARYGILAGSSARSRESARWPSIRSGSSRHFAAGNVCWRWTLRPRLPGNSCASD